MMNNEHLKVDSPPVPSDEQSIRSQVRLAILKKIQSGEFAVGVQIPTATVLATQFKTSRSNVHKAIKQLEEDGLVQRYRRRGTFVKRQKQISQPSRRVEKVRRSGVVHLVRRDMSGISEQQSAAELSMYAYQFEETLNAAGLRVVHLPISPVPTVEELGEIAYRAAAEGSEGLAILANLAATPGHSSDLADDASLLLPYVEKLRAFPGRICWLNWAGLPLTRWPFDSVSFMPFQEGLIAGEYLVENQVRRVVWWGVETAGWSRMRYDGLRTALSDTAAAPIRLDEHWSPPSRMPAVQAKLELFGPVLDDVSQRGDRPTLVVCGDVFASMLLDVARDRGMACPRDFCVISFDNANPTCGHNLTTIAPPVTKVGGAMAEIFTGQIERRGGGPITIGLPSFVVERSTFVAHDLAPPSKGD